MRADTFRIEFSGNEMSDHERAGGIQVIARAAAIMRTLGDHPKGLSLARIAREVNLPRSTVQRIITALEDERLVEPLGPGGGFRLGPALGQLLNRTQSDIISMVGPSIEAAAENLQETVILASLVGDKVFIVYCAVAKRELRIVFPVGMHAPAYATAAGKILLANQDDSALKTLLPKTIPQHTPLTLNASELNQQLASIRQEGMAYEEEEYIEGVSALAVSVTTYLGNYAITVIAPTTRAARRKALFVEALLSIKSEIESNIGAVFNPE